MKKLSTFLIATFYSISTMLGLTAMVPATVHAASTPAPTKTVSKAVVYNYTAQAKDSYSKIARKAVQTYGKKNKIALNNARVIAAETWLTKDAGSPQLVLGQKISIPEATVKAAVDKAVKLSDAKVKAWSVYTVGVNFNTNSVGQSK